MEAKIWELEIPLAEILKTYCEEEDPLTGTVVIHAGRVKLPGKVKAGMTHVLLQPCVNDPGKGLSGIGKEAMERFGITRVHVHHRLGRALPGEYLLVVFASAVTRGPAFEACRWIVDEIKREGIIRLVEME